MIKQLCDIRDTVFRLQMQLRFGRLSRAPLRILRLEWRGDHANCDWVARAQDAWDEDLPERVGNSNVSLQALEDAIGVRDLLLSALPDISSATLRVYRECPDGSLELIITGNVTRSERFFYRVHSLAMRAKLYGFQFFLNEGALMAFQMDEGGL
jgi:hypothetical protein